MNKTSLRSLPIVGLLMYLYVSVAMAQHPASFVWCADKSQMRHDLVCFRYDFELESLPDSAILHLFAASHYHLFVNGTFINFGPLRSYPAHPVYDSYEMRSLLKEGRNNLIVKVLYNGTYTYQVPLAKPSFIAWGGVFLAGRSLVDLSTPGGWKCQRSDVYNHDAPKLSFAKGPIEIYDARKEANIWLADKPEGIWQPPVRLSYQDYWGRLLPRYLPPLTQERYAARSCRGIYTLSDKEDIYFFRAKAPDASQDEFQARTTAYACTYIYSPKDQDINAYVWWGDHWLNGEGPLKRTETPLAGNNREVCTLSLKKGWNFYFAQGSAVWGSWEYYLALPAEAGLKLSPTKKENDSVYFFVSGPFPQAMVEKQKKLSLPFVSPESLPAKLGQWRPASNAASEANPAYETAWRQLGDSLPCLASQVSDITVSSPSGNAIVFDMGGKKLARFAVEYEAPAGTCIDVVFAEDMNGKKANALKRAGIYTGFRHIARQGHNYFETFRPYGFSLVQLNVTGNKGHAVHIKRVEAISQVYPFRKQGSFECSDPMFNAIWELGWRTLRVCSEDTYTDTPFRERGLYAGDALPEFAITLATSGDPRLIKYSIDVFQDKYSNLFYEGVPENPDEQGLISDFPLITLLFYSWYVHYTGDKEFAQKHYEAYKHLVNYYLALRRDDGLIYHPRAFIEWTTIDKNARLSTMHALIAESCRQLSYVSDLLGKAEDKQVYAQKYNDLAEFVRTRFWNEEEGAYRDGFNAEGPIDNYFPNSSAWPGLWDITTKEQEERLRPFYAKALSDIGNINRQRLTTPYGSFYLLGSLYKHGNEDIAEAFMRKYWSPMILKYDDTAWENFGSEGIGTLSHAWSGGPTFWLTTKALGVDLGFPNRFNPDTLLVAPQSATLSWARGTVPHPRGLVSVEWRIWGNRLLVECEVPQGLALKVAPRGRLATYELWVNGEKQ